MNKQIETFCRVVNFIRKVGNWLQNTCCMELIVLGKQPWRRSWLEDGGTRRKLEVYPKHRFVLKVFSFGSKVLLVVARKCLSLLRSIIHLQLYCEAPKPRTQLDTQFILKILNIFSRNIKLKAFSFQTVKTKTIFSQFT